MKFLRSAFFIVLNLLPLFWFSQSYADNTSNSNPNSANSELIQQINQMVAAKMQQNAIPGLALAIMIDGKPFLIKGYGFSNVNSQQPVTPNTLFAIGSVSKVVTAMAIMQLVEAGKIQLQDSILKYIPDAPAAWQNVTIQELMSHSSGIPQHQGPHLPWSATWQKVAQKPMQFQPGTDIKYNNFGFGVLGRVVEVVSGEPLADYLQSHIFQPANMPNTGFPAPLFPSGLATGYNSNNGAMVEHDNLKPWGQMWASGGVVSTINDMANWDAAMTQQALMSPATYRLMWTPVKLLNGQPAGHKDWAWGLGWQIASPDGHLEVWKDGAITGYSAFILRYINDRVSVIVLTNTTHTHLREFAERLARTVLAARGVNINNNPSET